MEEFRGVICAVGGGKGGVGKSLVAVNVACALAMGGKEVVLVDADLAGANVHTLFGIRRPPMTLNEFVGKAVGTIEDVLVRTRIPSLRLVCGATDFLDLANPGHARKQRILRAVSRLPADYIVVDIGAGATFNNIDFFNMADVGVLVTTTEPTAILSGYEFLKMAVRRKILCTCGTPDLKEPLAALLSGNGSERARKVGEVVESMMEIAPGASERISSLVDGMNLGLVVNGADAPEGEKVHRTLSDIAGQYLRVALPLLGCIPRSGEIERSVREMTPVVASCPSAASDSLREIARRIAAAGFAAGAGVPGNGSPQTSSAPPLPGPPWFRSPGFRRSPQSGSRAAASPADAPALPPLCLSETIPREGRTLHVHTEDRGPGRASVQTMVFLDGRVIFTRENGYAELGLPGAGIEEIRGKVRWQHRGILAGIRSGKLDREIAGTE